MEAVLAEVEADEKRMVEIAAKMLQAKDGTRYVSNSWLIPP